MSTTATCKEENRLGQKVKKLRKEHGWSQQELAEKVGCATGTISMIEIGKRQPSVEKLAKLANLFDVKTDYLLGLATRNYKFLD